MVEKYTKQAFTLAEVLITLAVIGVVAALTIPVIMNYAFERQAVSAAKETYSLLTQAIAQWQVDGNCTGDSAICPEVGPPVWPGGAPPHNSIEIAQALVAKLKVTDAIYGPSAATMAATTWVPDTATFLDGSVRNPDTLEPILGKDSGTDGDLGMGSYFALANGSVVKVNGMNWVYNLVFDINGAKKPNRMGKDQFVMSLYTPNRKSTNPYYYRQWGPLGGVCAEVLGAECNPDDGFSPLAYVLAHDKLPDLKAMGYPTTP